MALPSCRRGRLYPQMDGSATASRNCGVSTGRSLVTHGSRGLIKPTVTQARNRMSNPKDWTTPLDIERMVNSYDDEMRKRGMQPLKYRRVGRWSGSLIAAGASQSALRNTLKSGRLTHLVVHYGTLNDRFPGLSGDRDFRGRHSWTLGGHKGWRKRGGTLEIRVLDSLWKGPRWVAFWKVWAVANGAWSDRGGTGWIGGSVACAQPLRKPPPDPEPEPPCEALELRVDELEAELATARQAYEDLLAARLPKDASARLRDLADELDELMPPVIPGTVEVGMATPEVAA